MKGKALIGIIAAMAFNGTSCVLAQSAVGADAVKLQPRIRTTPLDASPTVTVDMQQLSAFLKPSFILDSKTSFDKAPYVIAQEGNSIGSGKGSILYVKDMNEPVASDPVYSLFKEGKLYIHPVNKEVLGFEARAIGSAELKSVGELSSFAVLKADEPIEVGARLFPDFRVRFKNQLTLKSPGTLKNEGYILSVRDGMNQIGKNDIVIISLGKREGMQEGHVLQIYQAGAPIVDSVHPKRKRTASVHLPDRRVGQLMVYQTYEKLSVALVLEATEVVSLMDKIRGQ